jgi:hypothetical protein
MNLKLVIKDDMLGRVEKIKDIDKGISLISIKERKKGIYSKFNLDGLFVSGKLSFKEAVEIRKFLNSQDKNLYSLFKNVSIIPCEKGLEITYGNQRYYVKGDN